MENDKKKKKNKIKKIFDINITNVHTFERTFSLRISKLKLSILGTTAILLLFVLVFSTFAFTNLKNILPGFDSNIRSYVLKNAKRADSLQFEIQKRDRFLKSIQDAISGKVQYKPEDNDDNKKDSSLDHKNKFDFKLSKEEDSFRKEVEKQEKYNLGLEKNTKQKYEAEMFFTPLKGLVTEKFNPLKEHFGIDIVAKENSKISAALDGTVIFTGWTTKTGHVIGVQHHNNVITMYKHNSLLLKKMGDKVNAGEAIAILGNTGELSTGTHLHFEIWKNGKPINPELFIKFK
ncbi:M23 family metallopeptidase [Marinilabiliaceae bacterium JC040]|nr:M23 family metallopeptidase [Marinilabiliaceae bacterium JC040]